MPAGSSCYACNELQRNDEPIEGQRRNSGTVLSGGRRAPKAKTAPEKKQSGGWGDLELPSGAGVQSGGWGDLELHSGAGVQSGGWGDLELPSGAGVQSGGKKKLAPKKKKLAPKKKLGGGIVDDLGMLAKKASTKKLGGGIVDDLGMLVVPLGLIAAKEGMEYLMHNRNAAKKAPKKAVGGGGEYAAYPVAPAVTGGSHRGGDADEPTIKMEGGTPHHRYTGPVIGSSSSSMTGGDWSPHPTAAGRRRRKPADGQGPGTGGGVMNDVANLAIPLGFVAAERVLSSVYRKKTAKTAKTPASSTKKSRRYGAFGGDGEQAPIVQEGFATVGVPVAYATGNAPVSGGSRGDGQLVPLVAGGASYMDSPINNPALGPTTPFCGKGMTGGAARPAKLKGGALLAAQHAQIAAEFRQMAAEIGAFLDKKSKSKAPKTPAGAKKASAAPKKRKAAKAIF